MPWQMRYCIQWTDQAEALSWLEENHLHSNSFLKNRWKMKQQIKETGACRWPHHTSQASQNNLQLRAHHLLLCFLTGPQVGEMNQINGCINCFESLFSLICESFLSHACKCVMTWVLGPKHRHQHQHPFIQWEHSYQLQYTACQQPNTAQTHSSDGMAPV